MAVVSNNNIITIHRGDTATFGIEINIGTRLHPLLYEMREGDMLYFAVMEPNQRWENAIIRKSFDYTKCVKEFFYVPVHFYSEDTEYLAPGIYYYEVKLHRAAENIDAGVDAVETIINKTKFIIID